MVARCPASTVQPALAFAGPTARIGCGAGAVGRHRFAPAPRVASRVAPRFAPRLPAAGTMRADVAPRAVRTPSVPAPFHRQPHTPRTPAPPRACPSVLLAAESRAHVRVQFAAGPARNCVLDGPRRFVILNAVEAMPRAPRGTRASAPTATVRHAGARHATARVRRARRRGARHACAVGTRERRTASGRTFDPPSPTGARPPCPHFAISATRGRPLRAQP